MFQKIGAASDENDKNERKCLEKAPTEIQTCFCPAHPTIYLCTSHSVCCIKLKYSHAAQELFLYNSSVAQLAKYFRPF